MLLASATTQQPPWDSRPQAFSPLGVQSCRPGPRQGGTDGYLTLGSSLSWPEWLLLGRVTTGRAKLRAPESSSLPTSGVSPSLAAGSAGRLSPLLCENQVKRGLAGLWIGAWIFHSQLAAALLRSRGSKKQHKKQGCGDILFLFHGWSFKPLELWWPGPLLTRGFQTIHPAPASTRPPVHL